MNFQLLTGTIETFFDKYECGKMVTNEYRQRLQSSKAICLHRFDKKAIHFLSPNWFDSEINIWKYDFADDNWEEFKTIKLQSVNLDFTAYSAICLNGELYLLYEQYDCISLQSYNLMDLTKTTLPTLPKYYNRIIPICIGKYLYVIGGQNTSNFDR